MQEYIEIETRHLKRIISDLERRNKKLIAEKEELQKQLNLHAVSQQREQLETVIKELDLQLGTNYSADENLIDTLMSSF